MVDKRFVVSVCIEGKEVVRKAVYAADAHALTKMSIFSNDEWATLSAAVADTEAEIKIAIKEDVSRVETG